MSFVIRSKVSIMFCKLGLQEYMNNNECCLNLFKFNTYKYRLKLNKLKL